MEGLSGPSFFTKKNIKEGYLTVPGYNFPFFIVKLVRTLKLKICWS